MKQMIGAVVIVKLASLRRVKINIVQGTTLKYIMPGKLS